MSSIHIDRSAVRERLVRERVALEEAERQAEEAARIEEEMRSKNRRHMGELTAWAWLSEVSWEELCETADMLNRETRCQWKHWTWGDLESSIENISLSVPIRHHSDYLVAVIETIIEAHKRVLRSPPF